MSSVVIGHHWSSSAVIGSHRFSDAPVYRYCVRATHSPRSQMLRELPFGVGGGGGGGGGQPRGFPRVSIVLDVYDKPALISCILNSHC